MISLIYAVLQRWWPIPTRGRQVAYRAAMAELIRTNRCGTDVERAAAWRGYVTAQDRLPGRVALRIDEELRTGAQT